MRVDAVVAEHVAVGVHGFDHAVCEEHDLITGHECDQLFGVDLVSLDAEWQLRARLSVSREPSAPRSSRGGLWPALA